LYLKQFDFSSLSSTSSIAEAVNSKTVREIPILVPPSELIAAFQDNVYPLFNQLKNAEALAANLSNMRDTLLPRLISGQIQIKTGEACKS
jgi:type I restriction enzyme S subunit